MAAARIKKGDRVIVLSGKDKGKTGDVTASMPKDGKVVVSGVNIAVRHAKPSQTDPQGGLKRSEAPLHVSKVARPFRDQGWQEGPRGREDRGDDQWLMRTRRVCASSMTRRSPRR